LISIGSSVHVHRVYLKTDAPLTAIPVYYPHPSNTSSHTDKDRKAVQLCRKWKADEKNGFHSSLGGENRVIKII